MDKHHSHSYVLRSYTIRCVRNSSMPIAIQCANCQAKFQVDEKLAGRTGKCARCGAKLEIPHGAVPVASPASMKPTVAGQATSSAQSVRPKPQQRPPGPQEIVSSLAAGPVEIASPPRYG